MAKHAGRILSAVVAVAALNSRADVIQLVDGTMLQGSVRRSQDGRWVVSVDGRPVFVAPSDVQSITISPLPTSTPQQAVDRLQSLRRSVANLSDLDRIVSAYESFLSTVKEPAATEPARRELADYQALSAAHAVRVGDHWLTPKQVDARLAAGPPPIEAARSALKEGRLDEARAALKVAATLTPDDPGVTYLASLIDIRQDNIPAAQAELNALLGVVPGHAPTLNNLAVIQWRQRQYLAALSSYDAALTAAPRSEVVLHNIAAALASVPDPFQSTPIYQQLSDHYEQQERLLETDLERRGLQRFGDSWLPAAQVAQLEQQQQQVQKELDAIADRFDQVQQQIEALDHRRATLLADRQRILGPEPTAFDLAYSGEGALSSPLSGDLTQDEQQDASQRRLLVRKLDALADQAKQLHARVVAPTTDLHQQVIGVEGTPFISRATPAIPAAPAIPAGVPATGVSLPSP